MAYLQPADYPNYGLPAGTTADWITAATALINSYCRRPDLNVIQYTERLRITKGSQTVRLTYLPLAPLETATTPIVGMEGRYARPRRGELPSEPLFEIARAFALPGQWVAIDPNSVDFDAATGEVALPWNLMGLPYNEISATYTAGWRQSATTSNRHARRSFATHRRHLRSMPAGPGLTQCRFSIFQVRWWTKPCKHGCVLM